MKNKIILITLALISFNTYSNEDIDHKFNNAVELHMKELSDKVEKFVTEKTENDFKNKLEITFKEMLYEFEMKNQLKEQC